MGVGRRCAAVAASAMVAAAAVGVAPDVLGDESSAGARSTEAALTATTIPIIDFDQTLGPLSLVRKLTATFDSNPPYTNSALEALSQTGWDGPLGALLDQMWGARMLVGSAYDPGEVAWLGITPESVGSLNVAPFGPSGPSFSGTGNPLTGVQARLYLGGSEGWGVGLLGVLLTGSGGASAGAPGASGGFGGSGFLGFLRDARLAVFPGGGLHANLDVIPVQGDGSAGLTVGPVDVDGTGSVLTEAAVEVCTGSAVAGCGGVITSTKGGANLYASGAITASGLGTLPVAVDLPNNLEVKLKTDGLAVTGSVGGTLTVGSTTIGQIVPINLQIPLSTPFTVAATRVPAATAVRTAAAVDTVAQDPPENTPTATPRRPHDPRTAAGHTPRHDKPGTARSARNPQRSSAD